MNLSITLSRTLISIIALASLQTPSIKAGFPLKGPNSGIFNYIRNGICPEGMQQAVAILAGGCVALPGIALENNLKNTYSDITPPVSIGLRSASAIIGAYSAYKINQLLSKRTPTAIFKQKELLLEKISELATADRLLDRVTVIDKLKIKFAEQADQGILVLIKEYLTQLINDISWVNEKLEALGEPLIDKQIVIALKDALAKVVTNDFFISQLKLNKQYNEYEYNNRLSTKIKYSSWWLTKNGVKTSVKASWYLTKIAASMCWDTFKIILHSILNKI